MTDHQSFLIGGRWTPPAGSARRAVRNPSTEEIAGSVPEATAEDVDRAVEAASAAFEPWSRTSPAERADALRRLQRGVLRHRQELAELIATEVGAPLRMALEVHVAVPARVLGSYARLVEAYPWREEAGRSLLLREAAGVAGCITPWNFPLHQAVAKVAAALAAGCTVVLKPSEITPLTAFRFAEIVHEAELPAGVFNLVCG
ncbi:MAG: aldehyde dehydrogenase family protein, partial [Acidobacteria bacterium]|nr:aldehyde dehydrogenase family protein [Acidobacteriota bacterium]